MKKSIIVLALLAMIPFILFAQGLPDVVAKAATIANLIVPVVIFFAANIIKGWIGSESKSINWLIYAVTAVCLGVAYAMMGFPKISLAELLGSSGAIWGVWTIVKEQVLGKS